IIASMLCHRVSYGGAMMIVSMFGHRELSYGGSQVGPAPAAAWSGVPRRVIVTPSPVAVIEKVPAVLEVYVYANPQAGDPPGGGLGIEAMNGPALWFSPLTAAVVRTGNAGGRVPMWAAYWRTAQARVAVSYWALAGRAPRPTLA